MSKLPNININISVVSDTISESSNVKAIEDMETLKNYDYRTGYLEKLRF